jgi:hypothetical protein
MFAVVTSRREVLVILVMLVIRRGMKTPGKKKVILINERFGTKSKCYARHP